MLSEKVRHVKESSRQGTRRNLFKANSYITFAALNTADIESTYAGIHNTNSMREGNPLVNDMLGHYGFGAFILYKLFVVAAVTSGVLYLNHQNKRVGRTTLGICNAMVSAVVASNLVQTLL